MQLAHNNLCVSVGRCLLSCEARFSQPRLDVQPILASGSALLNQIETTEQQHEFKTAAQLGLGPYAGHAFAVTGVQNSDTTKIAQSGMPWNYVPVKVASSDNFTLFFDEPVQAQIGRAGAEGGSWFELIST
eukprot:6534863-Pyramimonas_sp.AAC.2